MNLKLSFTSHPGDPEKAITPALILTSLEDECDENGNIMACYDLAFGWWHWAIRLSFARIISRPPHEHYGTEGWEE